MSTIQSPLTQSLRIGASDVLAWQRAGQPMTILDVRNARAWESSPVKIQGAIRLQPPEFQVDLTLPKDRPTVVY